MSVNFRRHPFGEKFVTDYGTLAYRGLPQGLIYLATPYASYKPCRGTAYMHACQLAAKLMLLGVRIFCPIAHYHPIVVYGAGIDPVDHKFWDEQNTPFMVAASAMLIAKMPGWRESNGIAREIIKFTSLEKRIFELDPETLEITKR